MTPSVRASIRKHYVKKNGKLILTRKKPLLRSVALVGRVTDVEKNGLISFRISTFIQKNSEVVVREDSVLKAFKLVDIKNNLAAKRPKGGIIIDINKRWKPIK